MATYDVMHVCDRSSDQSWRRHRRPSHLLASAIIPNFSQSIVQPHPLCKAHISDPVQINWTWAGQHCHSSPLGLSRCSALRSHDIPSVVSSHHRWADCKSCCTDLQKNLWSGRHWHSMHDQPNCIFNCIIYLTLGGGGRSLGMIELLHTTKSIKARLCAAAAQTDGYL